MAIESVIDKLAFSFGIESEYVDNWGRIHPTSLEIKKKILSAIGTPVDTEHQVESALQDLLAEESCRLADPFIMAWSHNPPKELVFKLPVETEKPGFDDLTVSLVVTDEKGDTLDSFYRQSELAYLGIIDKAGATFHQWSLPFPALDGNGYYDFRLIVNHKDHHMAQHIAVAMCPPQAYLPTSVEGKGRTAGISLSLYGVRSLKNWGIGDFGDLKDIVDWVAEKLDGNVIGLNPLHATYNRRPFNVSPYLPISKFYRNVVYLDVSSMEDYGECQKAREMVESAETQHLLNELRASETVEYEKVAALKMKVLKLLFESFLEFHWNQKGRKTDRGVELEQYIANEGELLENFATFCALDSAMHANDPTVWIWPQWPREYQRPDTEAVRQFKEEQWDNVLFYKYLQWQLEKQLVAVQDYAISRGMTIGLYHDLALAIDRFGADFWAYQDCFFPHLRVGAPPDAFSQNGQDWGFPPPRIDTLKARGYDLFIKEIRKNCAFGGALRIDHAMRFFHLYCIPNGESPEHGVYVSQPEEDLLGIVMLESVRNQVVIIGEDLGTVPQYIRKRLGQAGIFSYRLLYFEKDEHGDFLRPKEYPELALVTIATHDLPTFVGFWTDEDMEIRQKAGLFKTCEARIEVAAERKADKEKLIRLSNELGLLKDGHSRGTDGFQSVSGELHNAVTGLLAMTPCRFFILSQEDLLKDINQQNLPGTTHQYPNWSLKMKFSIEELFGNHEVKGYCKMFREWVHKSGRTNLHKKGEV